MGLGLHRVGVRVRARVGLRVRVAVRVRVGIRVGVRVGVRRQAEHAEEREVGQQSQRQGHLARLEAGVRMRPGLGLGSRGEGQVGGKVSQGH